MLANGTTSADTEMTDEPIQPGVPHIKHENNLEVAVPLHVLEPSANCLLQASLQTPPSLPLASTPNAHLQPTNPPPAEVQQLTPLNGATSSSSSLNTITYPPTTHIPPPTAPVPNLPITTTHTQPPVAATRASTPSAGPSAASSLLPSGIIPPANPSGSPTRVYLNQKVTPVLLEGMKWIAANE